MQDFAAAANELARRGVASLALDLPGFGASPAPRRRWGASLRRTGDARAARDRWRPFVLVGHSFGGTVACVAPADHPDVVRSLVLTGAPFLAKPIVIVLADRYRVLRWLHARGGRE